MHTLLFSSGRRSNRSDGGERDGSAKPLRENRSMWLTSMRDCRNRCRDGGSSRSGRRRDVELVVERSLRLDGSGVFGDDWGNVRSAMVSVTYCGCSSSWSRA